MTRAVNNAFPTLTQDVSTGSGVYPPPTQDVAHTFITNSPADEALDRIDEFDTAATALTVPELRDAALSQVLRFRQQMPNVDADDVIGATEAALSSAD